MNHFKEIYNFFRHPDYGELENLSVQQKLVICFKLFLTYILCAFCVSLIYVLVTSIFPIPKIENHAVHPVFEYSAISNNKSLLFFIVAVFGPIIEEFTFRYSMTKFEVKKVLVSYSLILSMFVCSLIGKVNLINLTSDFSHEYVIMINYSIVLAIAGMIYFIIFNYLKDKKNRIEDKWNINFPYVFYILSVTFALMHANVATWIGLILTFIIACMMGYARVKLGFIYAIIMHITFNSVVCIKLLLG